MKGKTILSLQKISVIFLVIVIAIVFQSKALGQELTADQKGVWETVESYWKTWKENGSEKLRPFYRKSFAYWGALSAWPAGRTSTDPPPGVADGLGGAIDSYELTLHEVKVWGNVAVTMYESKVIFMGKPHRIRCTDSWMKEADKWQIIGTMRDSCSALPKCP
jgi:hypothetical protein